MKDYYGILGVDPSATARELRAAWRRMAFRWHPDRNPDGGEEAHRHFLQAGEAFAVLSDPLARAAHDRKLFERASREQARAGGGPPSADGVAAAPGAGVPSGMGDEEPPPLFREEELIRKMMLALASASARVRLLSRLMRTAALVVGGLLWLVLQVSLPEIYPPHGKDVMVALVAGLTTALLWVMATIWKARQAMAYRAYAERLVRRRRAGTT